MIYKVKAKYVKDKTGEFFQKLTDGTITGQQPRLYLEILLEILFQTISIVYFLVNVQAFSTGYFL